VDRLLHVLPIVAGKADSWTVERWVAGPPGRWAAGPLAAASCTRCD